jgi:hypothetical protein
MGGGPGTLTGISAEWSLRNTQLKTYHGKRDAYFFFLRV